MDSVGNCVKPSLTSASCVSTGHQHVFYFVQVSIMNLWLYSQQVAHQWVHIYQVKGVHQEVLLEVGPHGSEEDFHVHDFVVKTVLSFDVVQRQKLKWTQNIDVRKLQQSYSQNLL